MTKYLVSDTHLFHDKLLSFMHRPYANMDEMVQAFIDEWNGIVKDDDVVYHLGDFALGTDLDAIGAVIKHLSGRMYLILGNHDTPNKVAFYSTFPNIKIFGSVNIDGYLLTHQPVHPSLLGERTVRSEGFGDQYNIHGHCVDMSTDILTVDGFKKRNDIKPGDRIYSLNKNTGLLEEDIINEIIDVNYTGNVYDFSRMRVTADHTMVVFNSAKQLQEIKASVLSTRCVFHWITSGRILRSYSVNLSDDLLRLYIYLAADGSIIEFKRTKLCRIAVKRAHKKKYVSDLLNRIGISYRASVKGDGVTVTYSFSLPEELYGWNIKGLDRKLTMCNQHQFEVVLDAYANSDGHRPRGSKTNVIVYTQKEGEADLLQEIAYLNGYQAKKYSRHHGFGKNLQHQVSFTKGTTRMWSSHANGKIPISNVQAEHFWCIKCNNQNFISRYNGYVQITGNCHRPNTVDDPRYFNMCWDVREKDDGRHILSLAEVKERIQKQIDEWDMSAGGTD